MDVDIDVGLDVDANLGINLYAFHTSVTWLKEKQYIES